MCALSVSVSGSRTAKPTAKQGNTVPSAEGHSLTENTRAVKTKTMIVAFTGPVGAGKSTAAEALSSTFHARDVSFALPIRNIAHYVGYDPHNRELKETPSPQHNGVSYREFAQKAGDFLKEVFGEEWLAKRALEGIESRVVIGDLRFDYEARAVREMGGKVVHISRPSSPFSLAEERLQHVSERGVDPKLVDISLVNDCKTKEEWEKKVCHELARCFVE